MKPVQALAGAANRLAAAAGRRPVLMPLIGWPTILLLYYIWDSLDAGRWWINSLFGGSRSATRRLAPPGAASSGPARVSTELPRGPPLVGSQDDPMRAELQAAAAAVAGSTEQLFGGTAAVLRPRRLLAAAKALHARLGAGSPAGCVSPDLQWELADRVWSVSSFPKADRASAASLSMTNAAPLSRHKHAAFSTALGSLSV